jgi:hypothetical protein
MNLQFPEIYPVLITVKKSQSENFHSDYQTVRNKGGY